MVLKNSNIRLGSGNRKNLIYGSFKLVLNKNLETSKTAFQFVSISHEKSESRVLNLIWLYVIKFEEDWGKIWRFEAYINYEDWQ